MGKVYFLTDTKINEEPMLTEPLYVIQDEDRKRFFDDIFNITDMKEFENRPDKDEFITTIFSMVEDYFADFGKVEYAYITAVDKNTHIFQWGIKVKRLDDERVSTSLVNWKAYDREYSYYNPCNVINKVTTEDYSQWIEGFVRTVLNKAEIFCDEVVIEDVEESKRINLIVDGIEYTIRTWNYHAIQKDENGEPCAENVRYTLYKMVADETGSHGEPVIDGESDVWWDNNVA